MNYEWSNHTHVWTDKQIQTDIIHLKAKEKKGNVASKRNKVTNQHFSLEKVLNLN